VIPEHIPYGSISAAKEGLALGLALDGSGVVGNYSNPDASVLTLVGLDSAMHCSVAAMITKQATQSGRYEKEYTISADADAVSVLEELRTAVKENMQNGSKQKKYFLVIQNLPEVYRSLPDEQRTLLDKFILHGGTKFGIDCLFTAVPKRLAELPNNDGGVIPASVTLFRRPMLYLDNEVTKSNARFEAKGLNDSPMGAEDAEYVEGFDEKRHAVRIRRMLAR